MHLGRLIGRNASGHKDALSNLQNHLDSPSILANDGCGEGEVLLSLFFISEMVMQSFFL